MVIIHQYAIIMFNLKINYNELVQQSRVIKINYVFNLKINPS